VLGPSRNFTNSRLRNTALRTALTTAAATLVLSSSALAKVVTGMPHREARNAPAMTGLALGFKVLAAGQTHNPSVNRELNDATYAACNTAPNGSPCLSSVLAAINSARASEGVAAMILPGNFTSLTVPQQLLVLANLERGARGLSPVSGLAGSLNAVAARAAAADEDPMVNNYNGDALTSNWAGGTESSLVADFLWMYDDGPGSLNVDCVQPGDPGCWGHRDDILYPFDNPVAMGAGYAASTPYGASFAEMFVGGETAMGPGQADALSAPTWATLAQSLMVGVSTTSIQLAGGQQSAQLELTAPGQSMDVGAAITSGTGAWHISQPGCSLAAGASCQLTISVSPGGLGSSGTLTLTGPAGQQNVSLRSQAQGTLAIRLAKNRVRRGSSVAIFGRLRRIGGTGAGGQSVRLERVTPSGETAKVLGSRRTGSGGGVTFHVAPRQSAAYRLAFRGSPTIAATSTAPATVRVAGRFTARIARSRRHHRHRRLSRG
jgi:hypothetical protein